VGAVGAAVGAAVGGALLKRIGGFGGMRDDRLTLAGALHEAAGTKGGSSSGHGSGHGSIHGSGHGGFHGSGHGGFHSGEGQGSASSGLAGAGGLENDEEGAALVVRHLERLRGQWQGVLQDEVYERAVGWLLEGVVRTLVQPVLEAECITECAANDIVRVYQAIRRAQTVFPGVDDLKMSRVVSSWGRFCALSDLLGYSLNDLAEWLPRRKFVTFTGGEMSSLIRALFEDSSRRQALLKSIADMTS
jgi:hypothetical protein